LLDEGLRLSGRESLSPDGAIPQLKDAELFRIGDGAAAESAAGAPDRRTVRELQHLNARDFRLTLYVVADTLRIEVTDTRGDRLPQTQLPLPDSESGRGLVLVDALADKWGVAPGLSPRKTVWAEVGLSPHAKNPDFGATGGLVQETRR
jgi:hypothetical protein